MGKILEGRHGLPSLNPIVPQAGLVALDILVLSIPLDLVFRLDVYGRLEYDLKWYWLFGLVSRGVRTGKNTSKKKLSKDRFSIMNLLRGLQASSEFLRIQGLGRQLWKLIKGLFHNLRIRHLEADFL